MEGLSYYPAADSDDLLPHYSCFRSETNFPTASSEPYPGSDPATKHCFRVPSSAWGPEGSSACPWNGQTFQGKDQRKLLARAHSLPPLCTSQRCICFSSCLALLSTVNTLVQYVLRVHYASRPWMRRDEEDTLPSRSTRRSPVDRHVKWLGRSAESTLRVTR